MSLPSSSHRVEENCAVGNVRNVQTFRAEENLLCFGAETSAQHSPQRVTLAGVVRGQQLGKETVQAVTRETLGASVSDAWSATPVLKLQVRDVPVSELFNGEKITGAQMREVKEVGVERLK